MDILMIAHIFAQKPGESARIVVNPVHVIPGKELTMRIMVAMVALAFQSLATQPILANQARTQATGRAQQPAGQPPLRGRRGPPQQPQQRQGIEYFLGSWHFEWTGRESAVSVGPRTGTVTFARKDDSNVLDMQTEGQTDAGAAYKESGIAEWNDAQKTLTFRERLTSGVELLSPGNWSSPLSIRSESQPVRAGSQTIRVRRTYMIISAQSFTLAEEMSIDGGPFQRLGNATYSKSQP
jgi:hypothetical protein